MLSRISRAALGLLLTPGVLLAQTQTPPGHQTFHLVSVKKTHQVRCPVLEGCSSTFVLDVAPSMTALPGGRFEARGQTLEDLARVAFGFEDVDPRRGVVQRPFVFAPGEDRFDITAVARGEWTSPPLGESVPAELRTMLRALLEDRFQLKARVQTRKVEVLGLRVAHSSGEPGPGLRRSSAECLGPYTAAASAIEQATCPFLLDMTRLSAGAVTMPEVARLIWRFQGSQADHLVVDQTELSGAWDVTLSLSLVRPDQLKPSTTGHSDNDSGPPAALLLAARRPTAIQDALKQQLGLTLQKTKAPIPTLIIERARQPIED